jgi:ubiquinone/menaquinone biosynthesis C-methylase UbiE
MGSPDYVLGSDETEIARLQMQAAVIAEPTALLLHRSGIGAGMRVLDLGTGPGDVAFQLANMVGPTGSVVGVDQDRAQLTAAENRTDALGLRNVTFREGDARRSKMASRSTPSPVVCCSFICPTPWTSSPIMYAHCRRGASL